jgi:hypothetical protein
MSDPVVIPMVADTWTLVATATMSAQIYPRGVSPGPPPAMFRFTYRDTGHAAPVNDTGVVIGLGDRDKAAPSYRAEFGEPVDLYVIAIGAAAECEVHEPMASVTPVDRLIVARMVALNMKTDEQNKSGVLNGVAAKHFSPTHVIARVTALTGAPHLDGTFNVGTAADGADILAAQTTTVLHIHGNATIHANVEAADTDAACTLELEVEIVGPQL